MKKIILIIGALVLLFAQPLYAQDTVDETDTYYMFNHLVTAGYYFVGNNVDTNDEMNLDFNLGSWKNVLQFEGPLGQKYSCGDTLIYGIAITMEPRWVIRGFDGRQDKFTTDTVHPLTVEHTKYWAVMYDSTAQLLDSVALDTSLSIIRRRYFKYEPGLPVAHDTSVSVYEFYFNEPITVSGDFYVGRFWDPYIIPKYFVRSEKYYSPLEYFGHVDFESGPYNFYLMGIPNQDSFFPSGVTQAWLMDENWMTNWSQTFPGNPWGFVFPITGLRCSAMKGVELTEQGQYYARLGWSDAQEGGEYALRIVDSTGSTVLKDTVADTTYMLSSLTPGMAYRAELRKSCRYDFTNDTTVLWGDPVTLLFAMEPEPVDTTVVDTTVVDTTGIRMVMVGDADFSLRPNPAGETAEVTMQYAVAERAELTLLDMQGRVVRRRTLPAGTRTATLELGGLPSGAYLLKVVTPQGLATRRLLKR